MKKLETAGRNTSVMPEMTPGRESGSVTRRNACTGVAPRSLAASSRLLSILASEVWICRIIKGMKLYTMPRMTAKLVWIIETGPMPKKPRMVLRIPSSCKMPIHA